jgi:hypothetical protein
MVPRPPRRRVLSSALCAAFLAIVAVGPRGGIPPAVADGDPAAPEDDAATRQRVEEARKAQAEADRAFAARVEAAIAKGAKWLADLQRGDGSFGGMRPGTLDKQDLGFNALCTYALAKCSATPNTAAVARGLRRVREYYDGRPPRGYDFKGTNQLMTYSVAAYLLALDAAVPPAPAAPPPPALPPGSRKPAKPGDASKPAGAPAFPPETAGVARELVAWLVRHHNVDAWRYPGGVLGIPADKDLSNTQLALLALAAAARRGIDVPLVTWEKTSAWLLSTQQQEGPPVVRWVRNEGFVPGLEDATEASRYGPFSAGPKDAARGWAYFPGLGVFSGSMTAAGLASVAIVKERLDASGALDAAKAAALDRSMIDGIAWLSANFTVTTNPGVGDGGWHYYYLYGLERAGALTGQAWFGKHDWYREGAEFLLAAQASDGSWAAAGEKDLNRTLQPKTLQTCFALLFLRRATVPPAKPIGPVLTKD